MALTRGRRASAGEYGRHRRCPGQPGQPAPDHGPHVGGRLDPRRRVRPRTHAQYARSDGQPARRLEFTEPVPGQHQRTGTRPHRSHHPRPHPPTRTRRRRTRTTVPGWRWKRAGRTAAGSPPGHRKWRSPSTTGRTRTTPPRCSPRCALPGRRRPSAWSASRPRRTRNWSGRSPPTATPCATTPGRTTSPWVAATKATIRTDLARTNAAIRAAVPDARIVYYRQPGGAWTSGVVATAWELGMTSLHWTVDPQDWTRPGAGSISSTVTASVRAGSIVLLHDAGGNRQQTVNAVKTFLPNLLRRFERGVPADRPAPGRRGGHGQAPVTSPSTV